MTPRTGPRRLDGRNREHGQIIVVFAICLVAIIAVAGLLIDGGMAWGNRRQAQAAADTSALAAAVKAAEGANTHRRDRRGSGRRHGEFLRDELHRLRRGGAHQRRHREPAAVGPGPNRSIATAGSSRSSPPGPCGRPSRGSSARPAGWCPPGRSPPSRSGWPRATSAR